MGRALLACLYVPTRPVPPLRPARYVLSLSRTLSSLSTPSEALLRPPSRRLRHPRSVSAGRFFAVGTISLCQTGAGLICEAFAGTSRPRIIIKIPHRRPPPPSRPPPLAAARRRSPSVILHSIPSWINPLMAGSLICAPLQNNRELRRRAWRGSVTRREVYYS